MAQIGASVRTALWVAAGAMLLMGCPYYKTGLPPPLRVAAIQAPVSVPPPGWYHSVARNETLFGIAKAYNVEMQVLAEVNSLTPPYHLREHAKLFIPDAHGPRPLEPPALDSVAPPTPPAPMAPVAPVSGQPPSEEFTGVLSWPVEGEILSEFGSRDGSQCNGITIKTAEGTPVRAAGPARVGHVGTMPGYGNVILLEHPNHMITVYAHLKEIRTAGGMTVRRGEIIGSVGTSGRVATPSLYFEVRSQRKPCNPLSLLPSRADAR